MRNLLVFLSLFLIIFLFGCAQTESVSTTTPTTPTTATTATTLVYDSYFPLISGRIITYEVTEITPTLESTTTETWEYVGNCLLNSIEVFQIDITYKGQTDPYYYREDSTGVYSYGYGSFTTIEPSVVLKYPLAVGSTWETGLAGSGWYYEVASEETVTNSLGSFVCRKIVPHVGLMVPTRWYAKNIGLIKASVYDASWEISSKNF